MNAERARYLADNLDRIAQQDRVLLNNPTMMQGMGLAPLVVAANTGGNALILAVAVLLLLTPTRILAGKLCVATNAKGPVRVLLYCLVNSVLYIGVYYILNAIFGVSLQAVGLYLPILVVEPLIIKRFERGKQQESVLTALRKGLRTTGGYMLVLLIVGLLREFLSLGTLFGVQIIHVTILPLMALPAGGFLVVGVLCAIWRTAVNAYKKYINLEAKRAV